MALRSEWTCVLQRHVGEDAEEERRKGQEVVEKEDTVQDGTATAMLLQLAGIVAFPGEQIRMLMPNVMLVIIICKLNAHRLRRRVCISIWTRVLYIKVYICVDRGI